MRAFLGHMAALGEVILLGLAVPVAILAAGIPVALAVGLALEVARLF